MDPQRQLGRSEPTLSLSFSPHADPLIVPVRVLVGEAKALRQRDVYFGQAAWTRVFVLWSTKGERYGGRWIKPSTPVEDPRTMRFNVFFAIVALMRLVTQTTSRCSGRFLLRHSIARARPEFCTLWDSTCSPQRDSSERTVKTRRWNPPSSRRSKD